MAAQTLAPIAQSAFSQASAYDKNRPVYTSTEADALLTLIGLNGRHGARVVDLGAGTGLFTEALAARAEEFDIVAVDPHDDMRGELEGKALRGVTVKKGWGSEIAVEDGSVDAVFAAQAFHWFANLDALKEIRRVLKPNGYLALLWHVDDYNGFQSDIPTTEWERIIKEHIWQHDDNVPRFRHGKWKAIFNAPGQTFFEQPVEEKDVPFTYYADVDALWGRLRTYSQFTNLEGEELQALREKFDAALSCDNVPRNEAGDVAVHGRTHYVWAKAI
ncbi:uncharacterized protein TRUGW13939_11141 [Talaromyces rugulosus]|uniref:Methyltransferase type 11 domain-containing protein n=1 Tax=Talaromyces rugulosus TaxID=121627 RepID=A0A7H8RDA0_TALRU|nr:uncharacterized protein TRUGW13939_11141 [Talaromyces rugulosus]QKX63968.1 hypothetical protein TRUGW13939_11141 [Talaromyces rugulosus]